MKLHDVYFDEEAPIAAAKAALLGLRESGNATAKAELLKQYQRHRPQKPTLAETFLSDAPIDLQGLEILARSVAISNRLEADCQKHTFEQALHGEHQRRKMQLTGIDAYMASEGYPDFDAGELFLRMGVGNGRVLISAPAIVPFHIPQNICFEHKVQNADPKLLSFEKASKTEGFYASLALFAVSVKNASGHDQRYIKSVIALDPQVMSATESLLTPAHAPSVTTATVQMLSGLRQLISYGMHDYVHHIILANTDPKTIKLRAWGDDAPLKHFRVPERMAMFGKNHRFKLDREHERFPGENNINGTTNVYELHAELVNRDVWQMLFEKMPAMKANAVRTATQFIADVETVREALAHTHGEDFARRLAGLMVTEAISRFLRVVDVDDPMLAAPMQLRGGKSMSFIGACNALTLTPLQVTQGNAQTWLDSLRLHQVTQPLTPMETPRLFQRFADNAERFPHVHKLWNMAMGHDTGRLSLTGFENVIMRGFGGDGPLLNTPALAYNFPKGKNPLLDVPGLLADNQRIMCTQDGGADPIPAAFNEEMERHRRTVARPRRGDGARGAG